MPRRRSAVNEKVEDPNIERRVTRGSMRKSVEGSSEASSPEKAKTPTSAKKTTPSPRSVAESLNFAFCLAFAVDFCDALYTSLYNSKELLAYVESMICINVDKLTKLNIECKCFTNVFAENGRKAWVIQLWQSYVNLMHKVITTMMIRSLDDSTYCARSTFLLIWGFGESCTIVHGITSEPEIVLRNNVLYWHFRQTPTGRPQFERDTFRLSVWVFVRTWGLRISQCDSPPIGYYELLNDTNRLTHTILVIWLAPLAFASIWPCVRPGYNDNYRFRSYSFVEQ